VDLLQPDREPVLGARNPGVESRGGAGHLRDHGRRRVRREGRSGTRAPPRAASGTARWTARRARSASCSANCCRARRRRLPGTSGKLITPRARARVATTTTSSRCATVAWGSSSRMRRGTVPRPPCSWR
jgi:hypothetical protein